MPGIRAHFDTKLSLVSKILLAKQQHHSAGLLPDEKDPGVDRLRQRMSFDHSNLLW